MAKQKKDMIQKNTFRVMIILLLCRILGFVKEMTVAKVFGSSDKTDAFYAAFALPDTMYDLLVAGALSSGFMPIFATYLADDDEDGAWKAANTFITVAVLFILAFNFIGIIFAKYLVPLVAVGNIANPEKFNLTVKLTRIMFTGVTFTVLAGLSKGVLESYKKFVAPAFGPVLYNLGFILGAVFFGKLLKLDIYGMAVGVIIGAFMNFYIQLPMVLRVGKGRLKASIDLKNPGYKRMIRLMGPAILGLSLSRINLLVNQNVASVLGSGSLTTLRFAQRIMMLPVGIFGASITTTIFPVMNLQMAKRDITGYKETFSMGLRTMLFLTIPCVAGLISLSQPIVRLLFRTGKFSESDVVITAYALAFYSLGVIGYSAVPVVTRAFYSTQNTKTPLFTGIIASIVNLLLNIFFIKFTNLSIGGIAFTSSLVTMFNFVLLYYILQRKLGDLNTKKNVHTIIKATMAAFVMGLSAHYASGLIEGFMGNTSKLAQLINVGFSIVVAVPIYFIIAKMLKMKEIEFVTGMINRKRKRKNLA